MTKLATTVIAGGIIVLHVYLLLQAIGAPVPGGGEGFDRDRLKLTMDDH